MWDWFIWILLGVFKKSLKVEHTTNEYESGRRLFIWERSDQQICTRIDGVGDWNYNLGPLEKNTKRSAFNGRE